MPRLAGQRLLRAPPPGAAPRRCRRCPRRRRPARRSRESPPACQSPCASADGQLHRREHADRRERQQKQHDAADGGARERRPSAAGAVTPARSRSACPSARPIRSTTRRTPPCPRGPARAARAPGCRRSCPSRRWRRPAARDRCRRLRRAGGAASARQQRAVGADELGVGQAAAAGDVSAAEPGRGSGSTPANRPAGRMSTTCSAPALEVGRACPRGSGPRRVEPRGEPRRRQPHRALLQRPAFAPPLAEAAVEHGGARVAERAEGPPRARRADVGARAVVDDEVVSVVQAQRAHLPRELLAPAAACAAGRSRDRWWRRDRRRPRPGCGRPRTRRRRSARPLGDTTRRRAREVRAGPAARPARPVETSAGSASAGGVTG